MKVIHPLTGRDIWSKLYTIDRSNAVSIIFNELKVCLGKYSSFADGFFIRQPKTKREAPLYKPLVLNHEMETFIQRYSLLGGPEFWSFFLSLVL